MWLFILNEPLALSLVVIFTAEVDAHSYMSMCGIIDIILMYGGLVVWCFGAVTADSDGGDEHPRVTTLLF